MRDPAVTSLPRAMAKQAEEVADLLKLLGNPQRLMIACLLVEGSFAVSEIEVRLGIRQPSLSQQLAALRESGLIEGRREAKAVIYHLKDARLGRLLSALHDIFCPNGVSVARVGDSRPVAVAAQGAEGAASFDRAGAAAFARLAAAGEG